MYMVWSLSIQLIVEPRLDSKKPLSDLVLFHFSSQCLDVVILKILITSKQVRRSTFYLPISTLSNQVPKSRKKSVFSKDAKSRSMMAKLAPKLSNIFGFTKLAKKSFCKFDASMSTHTLS
jgi:hypothetical protein